MARYPKFDKKIKETVIEPAAQQAARSPYGIILSYDPSNNTATVLSARPGSTQPGEIYHRVPCPQVLGIQSVDPQPGRGCFLSFPNKGLNSPVVTGYFSPSHNKWDYENQTRANNDTPTFMTEL